MDPNLADYPFATQTFMLPFEDLTRGSSGFTIACVDPIHVGFFNRKTTANIQTTGTRFSIRKPPVPRGLDKAEAWWPLYHFPSTEEHYESVETGAVQEPLLAFKVYVQPNIPTGFFTMLPYVTSI